MEERNNSTTYYIATERETMYIEYDEEHATAKMMGGCTVTITRERLTDFLHTAELLGMMAGVV